MNTFSHVPPGFRFHPTDEELVNYYLRKKVAAKKIDLDVIKDVDLYNIEPWDLIELCKLGTEDQDEWYFFSHKDKKYPTGTRTNRATKAGFWKATGRDKSIYCMRSLVGMRKTLVFYKGRAPNGQKSDWIMHEYRLETNENAAPQEEGWVVCRVFKKRSTTVRKMDDHETMCSWYDHDPVSFMPDFDSPVGQMPHYNNNLNFSCKQELDHNLQHYRPHEQFIQLPQLESPNVLPQADAVNLNCNSLTAFGFETSPTLSQEEYIQQSCQAPAQAQGLHVDHVSTDWRVLDKFVASQLSHDHQSGTS